MRRSAGPTPHGGSDTLTGTAFVDAINGDAGNDTMTGAIGDDDVNGGADTDACQGPGADRDILTSCNP